MTKPRAKPDSGRIGAGCLALLALPFAGVGVFMLALILSDVWDWLRMRSWVETPARIIAVRLIESRGKSASYEVEARYEYQVDGMRFVGERVGMNSGSDNIGSFHRDAYRELKRHRDAGRPFRAFVNPARPEQAILYREPRLGLIGFKLIFVLVFGGVGFGLLFGARYAKRQMGREAALMQSHPGEPWRWREAWRDGRIVSASKTTMIGAWVFAGFWNLVSAPVLFFVPGEVQKGNTLALAGLVFPVVGAGFLAWAIRSTLRWRRFGRTVFAMAQVPGVIGGSLRGAIETGTQIEARDGFNLTLSCIEKVTSGTGRNRRTREHILFQDRKLVPPTAMTFGTNGWQIPVHFAIPAGQRPTDQAESSSEVLWRLEVDAAVPGVDFHGQFEVPVFGTAQGAPLPGRDEKPDRGEFRDTRDPIQALAARGISVSMTPDGGRRIDFARARHQGVAIGLTVFTIAWMGLAWGLAVFGVPALFPIVTALFGLLLVYGALDLWLDQSSIVVRADAISVTRGWFGGKPATFDRATLRAVNIARGMQAGTRLYHDIKLETTSRGTLTAAKGIDDRWLAEQVKLLLERR